MAPAEEAPEVVGTWYSSRGIFVRRAGCVLGEGDGEWWLLCDGVGEMAGVWGEKIVAVEENFVRQNWAVRGAYTDDEAAVCLVSAGGILEDGVY